MFVNMTDKTISKGPVGNYHTRVNLHLPTKSKESVLEDFYYVATANQWDINDILCVGDYGNLVWLENDAVISSHMDDETWIQRDDFYSSIWKD